MKNFYYQIKNFINIALFLGIFLQSYIGNSQTTLATGDIIFTGYDSNPTAIEGDAYSFVLLKNILSGTTISFTDRGYFGSNTWQAPGSTESTVTWTAGSNITLGTEILIKGLSAYTYDPGTMVATLNGTVVSEEGSTANGLNLSNVGDQVMAFQGGGGLPEGGTALFISGLHYFYCASGAGTSQASWDNSGCSTGPNTSNIPPGLTGGTNAFYTGTLPGNVLAKSGSFNGTGAPFADAAAIRTAVTNQSNWTLSNVSPGVSMPSGAPFVGVAPTITGNPPNRTICIGNNTTFLVTASDATGYQWQVNTGSGFTNITNGAPYSGATTATLTITAVTAGMSGYLYRCVVSGTGSVTSSAGTLTVPNTIVTTTSQTNVSCKGGSNGTATLSSSGGIAPYTYSWSPSGGTAASATGLSAQTYTVTVTDNIGCAKTHTVIITEPAAVLVATPAAQTNVSCFGGSNGSATVAPTGGTPSYTYSWSPSGGTGATASGLTAGTYTCTVTDANSCIATQSFTITQPPTLAVTPASQTNIACFGGSTGAATINTPTGGTPGYTYNWTPGNPSGDGTTAVTGLTAGTWTCTVTDANGCTTSQSFTVTQSSPISVTPASQTNIACFGGVTGAAAINTPTGGAGGYTYNWTPGNPTGDGTTSVTGLTAGTWTCTVTDANNCTASQSFTVTQPSAITVTPASQTNIACFGGSTGAAAINTPSGGAGGYTYNWTPGNPTGDGTTSVTGLTAGTWTCTVTDANGCTAAQSFTVTQPSAITVSPASQTNISCFGGANGAAAINTPSGGAAGYTYNWTPGNPTGDGTTAVTGLTAGTWTCTVTDANGCTRAQSFTITQQSPISVTPASQTNIACNGGSNGTATINTPTGGAGGYTYDWTPGTPTGDGTTTVTGLTAGTWTCNVTDANGCTAAQSFTVTQPSVLAVTPAAQTNISCNGGSNGSATVNVSGGTSAYTYAWAPTGGTAATATGLSAGTYTVTVTDANGCTATQSFTVTQPAALIATPAAQTNVSCNGGSNGSATVNVSGGTSAYTYAWAPSGGTAATATGLSAGTYTVTVTDANGCTATQSFTITEPTAIVVTPSQTNISCNGDITGSASVSASGGTGAYAYSWSPTGGNAATATGLSAGTYTVTIIDDNFCITTQNFTITEPTAVTVTPASQTNIACNGSSTGAATINTPTGGTGAYTYDWTPGTPTGDGTTSVTGLTAGTWTCNVTDANGCSATQSFTITEPTVLVATPAAQTNVSCNGGSNGSATVNVSGGTSAYTYAWAPSGGTAATATGLSAGTYTVTVTDANGCTATQSFVLTEPNALTATIASQTNVSCNGGSNGSATVNVSGGTSAYTYAWAPFGGTAASASGLSAGTYTVTVTDANGCTATESITITEPTILDATTTQTNVTCPAQNNGSATVTPTGGTGAYTYSWSPSGGTSATATGLADGSYTVTIEDANGCQVIKSVTILTTPDTTAPVPDVTNLPIINSNCGIVSSEITVPTATDNCTGIISATTISPLNYNAVGTYVITWSYDDGNGNITTQNQTLNILASPLDQVTFSDTAYNFDGSIKTIQVANLPIGATVNYAISPTTGTANGATNAGVYALTATVSPSVSSPNCSPITLTASLTINKAAQQITFGSIPTKTLGGTNIFNLDATSNSGLPVSYTYTYTSALPAATVSTSGVVTMLESGEITITAHQDGNANYLPAPDVSQVLVIKNNDVSVMEITIGDQSYVNPAKNISYLMECGETNVDISIANATGATITPSPNFTITPPKPGIYAQNVKITSQDGTATANYTLTVEKPFGFFDIVKQKFNNVLLVNNNPQTNGGYEFVSYQWFKNGQLVGTGQYYSAGEDMSNNLDTAADYSVKMTTKDGKVLQTCASKISTQKAVSAKLYPNPVQTGKTVTVEADFPSEELENMQISLYTVSGQFIKVVKSSSKKTEIQLPNTDGNMYVVVIETANIKKTLKVIVNK